MYSAPLSGLCPSRPGADFTLARNTIKASGGRGSVKEWRIYTPAHVLRFPPPTQSHPVVSVPLPFVKIYFNSLLPC